MPATLMEASPLFGPHTSAKCPSSGPARPRPAGTGHRGLSGASRLPSGPAPGWAIRASLSVTLDHQTHVSAVANRNVNCSRRTPRSLELRDRLVA